MPSAIAYYRVSTARQGHSGLGLEAQRDAVRRFAEAEGIEIAGERIEVESGKGADALDRRPELAAALADARKAKCPIVVAKLDRLSRDVHFIRGRWPIRCRSWWPSSGRTSTPSCCTCSRRSPSASGR
jgi:DNA invertase Pin-like site-specific DNA recombinase